MGRAIVREPQAFLMDEPLSNLDAKLRVEMRTEIARLQRDLAVTTIFVTHDQVEAMTLGDRVLVLRDGFRQQIDTPQGSTTGPRTCSSPSSSAPSMNLVGFDLVRANSGFEAVFVGGRHRLRPAREPADRAFFAPGLREQAASFLGIRPEDLEDAVIAGDGGEDGSLEATVDIRKDLGSDVLVHFGRRASRPRRGRRRRARRGGPRGDRRAGAGESLFVARVDRESTAQEASQSG